MVGHKDTLQEIYSLMGQGWRFEQTTQFIEERDYHRRKTEKARQKGNQSEVTIGNHLHLIPWVNSITINPHNGPEDKLYRDLTVTINRRIFDLSLREPLVIPGYKVYIQAKSSIQGVIGFECRVAYQHNLNGKDRIEDFLKERQLVVLRADLEQREVLIQFLRAVLAMNIFWGRKQS